MKTLFVVIKIMGRCNLNCTYCNIFNGVDSTIYERPSQINGDIASKIGRFIDDAIKNKQCEKATVVLHGGEPLLINIPKFEVIINRLLSEISIKDAVSLTIQTNATLISHEWIDVFSKYKIGVGVSIDGDQATHDLYRIYPNGNGSFADVIRGISMLKSAQLEGRIKKVGALCVWNNKINPKKIYSLVFRKLNIESLDVLFPDSTHDTTPPVNKIGYIEFLQELIDEWAEDPNPKNSVRIINSIFSLLSGGNSLLSSLGESDSIAITVDPDGSLRLDDHLRSCAHGFTETGLNISNSTLTDFINTEKYKLVSSASNTIPSLCCSCPWERVCRGGELIHRYKNGNFNNKSIYCDELSKMFSHTSVKMIEGGYSLEKILESLRLNGSESFNENSGILKNNINQE
ncbi:TPA: radical SAM protein [Klebsiella quasipneumoniae subsp. similipneumoniae]|nr:radical SAM protein [Klebsiella quasipneumoniae subsp. similipneumoniae]